MGLHRLKQNVRPLNIPQKWLVGYCLIILVGVCVLILCGLGAAAVLLIGIAFCFFAAADVVTGLLRTPEKSKLRKILAGVSILAAMSGLAILGFALVTLA